MKQLSSLLATMNGIDDALDAIDPAELTRAIESLETLRTLYFARASARERQKPAPPIVSLAMMQADPVAAREKSEQCPNQIERAEQNRATVIEWLRNHQPASIDDISLATGIKLPAVRYIVSDTSLYTHDASTPYRYSLR